MAVEITRLDPTTNRVLTQTTDSRPNPKRVELFKESSFDSNGGGRVDLSALKETKATDESVAPEAERPLPRNIMLPNGTLIEIPTVADVERRRTLEVMRRVRPENREKTELVARAFAQALIDDANSPQGLSPTSFGLASTPAHKQAEEVSNINNANRSHEDATTDALNYGMYGLEKNLREFVTMLETEREMGEEIRADLLVLKDVINEWPGEGGTQTFKYHELVVHEDGTKELVEKTVELTREEAISLANKLEAQEGSLGATNTVNQMVLQRIVQGYQEGMSTLSNIMKTYDENLRGIISNSKAS